MKHRLSTTVMAACLLSAIAGPSAAQPGFVSDNGLRDSALEREAGAAIAFNVTLPLTGGTVSKDARSDSRYGLSFISRWDRDFAWNDHRKSGIGLTLAGDTYSDFAGQAVYLSDAITMLNADMDENGEKRSGSNTGLILVGGTILVAGGLAVAVAEVEDEVDDCLDRLDCE